MNVDERHPDYEQFSHYWMKMRHCVGGEPFVKQASPYGADATRASFPGEIYLPKLAGQGEKDYLAYKNRAWWYPATGRTVVGHRGAIFRKDPEKSELGKLKQYKENIDLNGMTLESFARDCVSEVLTTGRIIITASYDGSSPYLQLFTAEQLINWADNKFAILATSRTEFVEFKHKVIDQRIVIRREGEDFSGKWVVQKWEKENGKGEWKEVAEPGQEGPKSPVARGQYLDEIPLEVCGWTSVSMELELPPLLELANLNLSHYRNTADHENGIHFCGLPQPWAAGARAKEGETWNVGVPEVWLINDPAGKAGYAEMTGNSVQKIADTLTAKEGRMAAVGARFLEGQRKAVEAADTIKTRQGDEKSVLAAITDTVSEALTKALRIAGKFVGENPKSIEYKLNTDFVETSLSPQEMVHLMQVWQGGGMSQQTFLWNLKKGDRLPGTIEEEMDLIALEDPEPKGSGGTSEI